MSDLLKGYSEVEGAIPSMEEICLQVPLYKRFPFQKDKAPKIRLIRYFRGHLDTFCLKCDKESTFKCKNEDIGDNDFAIADGIFAHDFICSRNSYHTLLFLFQIEDKELFKIGQYPSLADLASHGLDKYRKSLGNERFSELNRAVGLAAHGVGIGAFVYLRRVFEFLLDEAYERAKKGENWADEAYKKSKITERIKLLAEFLPDFLVENHSLYGILSSGVHTLSEKECLDGFATVQLGIELILDQKIEKMEREAKILQAKKSISSLNQKLKEEKPE